MKGEFFLKLLTVFGALLGSVATVCAQAPRQHSILSRFNHEAHFDRVFSVEKMGCETCHNFKPDPKTQKLVFNADFAKSAFKKSFKTICHDCHTSEATRMRSAPQTCFTCHQSSENLSAIHPKNHNNVNWKSSHGSIARSDPASCSTCHLNSECATCHLRRNEIEFNNHTRNFRFYHSVQARGQPQTCESCHSANFCIDCHLRGK